MSVAKDGKRVFSVRRYVAGWERLTTEQDEEKQKKELRLNRGRVVHVPGKASSFEMLFCTYPKHALLIGRPCGSSNLKTHHNAEGGGTEGVKKFLLVTGAAGKQTFWRGHPRFSVQPSMTRRVPKNSETARRQ